MCPFLSYSSLAVYFSCNFSSYFSVDLKEPTLLTKPQPDTVKQVIPEPYQPKPIPEPKPAAPKMTDADWKPAPKPSSVQPEAEAPKARGNIVQAFLQSLCVMSQVLL